MPRVREVALPAIWVADGMVSITVREGVVEAGLLVLPASPLNGVKPEMMAGRLAVELDVEAERGAGSA